MDRTRRFWGEVALAGFLLGFAGVTGQVLPLLGGGGVAAVLLGRSFGFSRAAISVDARLDVTHDLDQSTVHVDDPVFMTVDARLPTPAPIDVVIEVVPPLPSRTPPDVDTALELPAGRTAAEVTFPIEVPVAGTYEFDPTIVTMTDPAGRFQETVTVDPGFTLTVDTHGSRASEVGRGSERDQTAFAGAGAGRTRPGTEPVEVREYVPGDTLRRIDWNATARLNRPHVREFETESERSLLLIVDHRSPLGLGPPDATAFDYLRTTALGVLSGARQRGEFVSLVLVGDDGVTTSQSSGATEDAYRGIRRHLLGIEVGPASEGRWPRAHGATWSPRRASRAATVLADDDSAFAAGLRPFFVPAGTHLHGRSDDTLLSAVRVAVERQRIPARAVLLTGDTNREELMRAVELLGLRGNEVSVFVAPMAAFVGGGPADRVPRDQPALADFEHYRRRLGAVEGVDVAAVGPSARLEPAGLDGT